MYLVRTLNNRGSHPMRFDGLTQSLFPRNGKLQAERGNFTTYAGLLSFLRIPSIRTLASQNIPLQASKH